MLAFLVHGYETIIQPFCCSYSVAGHEALQSAGFAPRLLGCEKLPGRWLMVVTEPLLGACMFDQMDAMEKPKDALRAAVAALHNAGFVHGDLRDCNVLARKQQVRTQLWSSQYLELDCPAHGMVACKNMLE